MNRKGGGTEEGATRFELRCFVRGAALADVVSTGEEKRGGSELEQAANGCKVSQHF